MTLLNKRHTKRLYFRFFIYQEINVVFSLAKIIYSSLRLPPRDVFNHISLTISKLVAQDVVYGLYLKVFVVASTYLYVLAHHSLLLKPLTTTAGQTAYSLLVYQCASWLNALNSLARLYATGGLVLLTGYRKPWLEWNIFSYFWSFSRFLSSLCLSYITKF